MKWSSVKSTKSEFYENKLLTSKGAQTKTWKILKNMINGVKVESKLEILFNDIKVNNNQAIANNKIINISLIVLKK